MPTIKLICTDIDGTMLRPDHSIGPRTKKGIIIALVSGRIRSSLVNIQNELGKPILEHSLRSNEIHHINTPI